MSSTPSYLTQGAPQDSESEYPHHADGNLDLSGSSIPGKPGRKKNPKSVLRTFPLLLI